MASDYFIRWRDSDAALRGVAEGLASVERDVRAALDRDITVMTRAELNHALGLCEGMRSVIERRPT